MNLRFRAPLQQTTQMKIKTTTVLLMAINHLRHQLSKITVQQHQRRLQPSNPNQSNSNHGGGSQSSTNNQNNQQQNTPPANKSNNTNTPSKQTPQAQSPKINHLPDTSTSIRYINQKQQ